MIEGDTTAVLRKGNNRLQRRQFRVRIGSVLRPKVEVKDGDEDQGSEPKSASGDGTKGPDAKARLWGIEHMILNESNDSSRFF